MVFSLAAVARKRPLHYSSILSAFLGFDPNFETSKGGHAASIQYALRTAFLGFLRCSHPPMIESEIGKGKPIVMNYWTPSRNKITCLEEAKITLDPALGIIGSLIELAVFDYLKVFSYSFFCRNAVIFLAEAFVKKSRDRLLRTLRLMNAGDAADQVMRQIDKKLKNSERMSRDSRFTKEDPPPSQLPVSGDLIRKKPMIQDNEVVANTDDMPLKRMRFSPAASSAQAAYPSSDIALDDAGANDISSKVPLLDNDLTPVEQMITMIGALLAEGERGAESLEILISKIHPDLMADIVIANMKHLPKSPPLLSSRLGNLPVTSEASLARTTTPPVPLPSAMVAGQHPSADNSGNVISVPLSDVSTTANLSADVKRDPRRDPRRLDPRRAPEPAGVQSATIKAEDINGSQPALDGSSSLGKPIALPAVKAEQTTVTLAPRDDTELSEGSTPLFSDTQTSEENPEIASDGNEILPATEVHTPESTLSPVRVVDQDLATSTSSDTTLMDGADTQMLDSDQSSALSRASEEICHDLPLIPLYVELTEEQQKSLGKLAVARILEAHGHILATGCSNACMVLLARLVAQMDADDDIVVMLRKHIVLDYQYKKGHELAMHVLYHLHAVMTSESDQDTCSFASTVYEKFLLALAKSLRDSLPASDKSFSRLLGEAPLLPDSVLKLLEELCYSEGFDKHEKDVRDGDRVTQGLGAVWSLILGRVPNRQACLNIALKCAVYSQEDVRSKAIRLVANKLYPLSFVAENIEQFATNMLLSVVDQQAPDVDKTRACSIELGSETSVGIQESSLSVSQNSEPGVSESDSVKGAQPTSPNAPAMSLSHAQRNMSLFFALCTKKPSLLQLVFDIYGRAPKAVKQAIHRHVPILVRNLGSSYLELLRIISNPSRGSENLLTLVLQILSEESTPSTDLIATVKHLYETKLKDAAILIPMLSSLSKDEALDLVLPIFPRLVDLPLEKFQSALDHILQGSAHTGPALTPAEVLVAIHDINTEKDGIPLKKARFLSIMQFARSVMDACTACFEQRTVFTQQVLVKALNQLVERTPLPLLFMRTVIQAIDAFPALARDTQVDFVMEILTKLVSKQIWKMPKLWVGFLKCASQTKPHSFRVLLKLPPAQLESALNKYPNLRGPLAAHANQPGIRPALPSTLRIPASPPKAIAAVTVQWQVVLGLLNESQTQRPYMPPPLHTSDAGSSSSTNEWVLQLSGMIPMPAVGILEDE
ncbi:hypothetical protein ACLOJK_003239 [Asimina triloba]